MDWIKDNYEKLVALVVAIICLIFGGTHVAKALNFNEAFPPPEANFKTEMPDDTTDKVRRMQRLVVEPFLFELMEVPVSGGSKKTLPLFVSVPIIERGGTLIDMGDPTAELLRPPVSNEWLLKHRLDALSANVLQQDPDRDGYTTIEEWEAETLPADPASHPPYTDKLAFVQMKTRTHIVTFKANNDPDFQVEEQTQRIGKKSKFYKVGEKLISGRFEILSYEPKEGLNNFGIKADLSELTLKDLNNDKTFVIVLKVEQNVPEKFAELNFTLDSSQSQFFKQEGDVFTLDMDPDTRYKLIEVTDEEAKIAKLDAAGAPGETITIAKGDISTPASETGLADDALNNF